MGDIEGKQAIIVGCIADDAYAVPAGPIGNISAVDTHIYKAVGGTDIFVVDGCILVDVVHIASSRISRLGQGVSTVDKGTSISIGQRTVKKLN